MAEGSNADFTYCFLETSKAERHVWLMKCPPLVARDMQTQQRQPPTPLSAADCTCIAKVIVAVDPLLPADDCSSTQKWDFLSSLFWPKGISIRWSYPVWWMETYPNAAQWTCRQILFPMSVFSESSQGRSYVEGKIYHKFDVKPQNEDCEDYTKLCRERTNRYMTRTRQIQEKKKVPIKLSEAKRTRRDPEGMEKIMFKLFEKQPNWTLKKLIQKTDQPEQFLKAMLKFLCVYNNKGANQGTYELKP